LFLVQPEIVFKLDKYSPRLDYCSNLLTYKNQPSLRGKFPRKAAIPVRLVFMNRNQTDEVGYKAICMKLTNLEACVEVTKTLL